MLSSKNVQDDAGAREEMLRRDFAPAAFSLLSLLSRLFAS